MMQLLDPNPNPFECGPAPRKEAIKDSRSENQYGSRVLVYNWFEDRRQYHQYCTRCTGPSIYKTDYLAHHAEDYANKQCLPPAKYENRRKAEGVGWNLIRNTEDCCQYLRNYTTTYDLAHNWEVRRAGCIPKPSRRWKLQIDGQWFPQPDNAVSFGNLTQIGYRQAPQLPVVPNDWQTYNMDTTYKYTYQRPRHPEGYTLCRYASPKCVAKEVEDMALERRPGLCDCYLYTIPKNPKDNDAVKYASCNGTVYSYIPNAPRFHPTLAPVHTLKSKAAKQNLFANRHGNYEKIKRTPNPPPVPGEPIYESTCGHSCDNKEICEEVQQARKFNQGPYVNTC